MCRKNNLWSHSGWIDGAEIDKSCTDKNTGRLRKYITEGRQGHWLIRRLLVRSPVPYVNMLKCLWTMYWNPTGHWWLYCHWGVGMGCVSNKGVYVWKCVWMWHIVQSTLRGGEKWSGFFEHKQILSDEWFEFISLLSCWLFLLLLLLLSILTYVYSFSYSSTVGQFQSASLQKKYLSLRLFLKKKEKRPLLLPYFLI